MTMYRGRMDLRDRGRARRGRVGFTTLYVRALGLLLVVQGLGGAVAKLSGGDAADVAHSGVHLLSGVVGLAMATGPGAHERARRFARGFGVFYLALGLVGPAWRNPFGVMPLGPADHLFHLIIAALTLVVGAAGGRPGVARTRLDD